MADRQIHDVLRWLNNNYGRGTIDEIEFHRHSKIVRIRIPITQSTFYYVHRKFRVEGDTVYFAGHQKSWSRLPIWARTIP